MAKNLIAAPTILIPGITGAGLEDQYPLNADTVWSPFGSKLPVVKNWLGEMDRLKMHPDSPGRNQQAGSDSASRRWFEALQPNRIVPSTLTSLVYGDALQTLRYELSARPEESVPVYPFGYDWRQPLPWIAEQLADFIDEVLDRSRLMKLYHSSRQSLRVNLVAHSMGGLVVAAYLLANGCEKINRIVTVATPFQGSVDGLARMIVGSGGKGGPEDREAARVTPGLYYLLPRFDMGYKGTKNRYPWIGPSRIVNTGKQASMTHWRSIFGNLRWRRPMETAPTHNQRV